MHAPTAYEFTDWGPTPRSGFVQHGARRGQAAAGFRFGANADCRTAPKFGVTHYEGIGVTDWTEVSRVAYQLSLDHGLRAHLYAAKLAKVAAQERKTEDEQFWKAVEGTLLPRGIDCDT